MAAWLSGDGKLFGHDGRVLGEVDDELVDEVERAPLGPAEEAGRGAGDSRGASSRSTRSDRCRYGSWVGQSERSTAQALPFAP